MLKLLQKRKSLLAFLLFVAVHVITSKLNQYLKFITERDYLRSLQVTCTATRPHKSQRRGQTPLEFLRDFPTPGSRATYESQGEGRMLPWPTQSSSADNE
jgi:hypothetical protein